MTSSPTTSLRIERADLDRVFAMKYGPVESTGRLPRRRHASGYFLPAEHYEAVVDKLVRPGTRWLDVGAGRSPFPQNEALAAELAGRCGRFFGVDPSPNVHENPHLHGCAQTALESFETDERFDLATLRMVAEHVEDPRALAGALAGLLAPGGHAVIWTVNLWSPITFVSRFTPFALHHPLKRLVWGGEEKDTFPVAYKMNTRSRLRGLFDGAGFDEAYFAHVDDLSTFSRFWFLGGVELAGQKLCSAIGMSYPENTLLGVYRKR